MASDYKVTQLLTLPIFAESETRAEDDGSSAGVHPHLNPFAHHDLLCADLDNNSNMSEIIEGLLYKIYPSCPSDAAAVAEVLRDLEGAVRFKPASQYGRNNERLRVDNRSAGWQPVGERHLKTGYVFITGDNMDIRPWVSTLRVGGSRYKCYFLLFLELTKNVG